MKILRNGQEFELTDNELSRAYEEFEIKCYIEDAAIYLDNDCCGYDDNVSQQTFKTLSEEDKDRILKKIAKVVFFNPDISFIEARRLDIEGYADYLMEKVKNGVKINDIIEEG